MVVCYQGEPDLEDGDYQWERRFWGGGKGVGGMSMDCILVGNYILLVGCLGNVEKGG